LDCAVVHSAVVDAVDVDEQDAVYYGPVPVDSDHSAAQVDVAVVERCSVRCHPVSVGMLAAQKLDADVLLSVGWFSTLQGISYLLVRVLSDVDTNIVFSNASYFAGVIPVFLPVVMVLRVVPKPDIVLSCSGGLFGLITLA
jgi:hypothetical protein